MSTKEQNYEYDYNTNFAPLAMLKTDFVDLFNLLFKQLSSGSWICKVMGFIGQILLNNWFTNQSLETTEAEKFINESYDSADPDQILYNRDNLDPILKSLNLVVEKNPENQNIREILDLWEKVLDQTKNSDTNVDDFLKLVEFVINPSEGSRDEGRPETLKGYEEQFKCIPLPEISNNFKDDLQFANMRVAGPNPLVIERMTEEDPRIPVTNDQYQSVMETSDSIQQAISDGRLYLADYGIFEDALQGTYPQEQKYICAPLAIFAVPEKGHKNYPYLCPIAIQCFQQPGSNNPIFTPKDGNWLIAKTMVQIADANFHEAISHLGRTHLFIEPFVIATYRHLNDHSLGKLLLPHFEGTLFINWGAETRLTSRDGGLDKLLAPTIDASRVVAIKGAQSYLFDFNGSMLQETLKRRGVDDTQKLPYYPYRDDALKIWDAIKNWVKGYLEIHYQDNSQVKTDHALQEWVKELLSHEGGRLKNFGENGQIPTLDYLIEATTMIIFTASAQHAAVNFPQSKIMSYTPAMPLAAYSPAPTTTTGSGDEEDLIPFLPTLEIARSQLNLTYLLGSVYYTKLGHYGKNFEDQLDQQNQKTALTNFKEQLKNIEHEIKQRNNEHSDFAYEYLMASKIPQSINI